jgi:HEAT repeat protein
MHRTILAVGIALIAFASLAEDLPPVSGGNGVTLRDLVGKGTLVSVVLKDRGATDHNLRVVEIGPNYFSVLTQNGERLPYTFESVAKVEIQDGRIETRKFSLDENRTLKVDEQKVVDRAIERAREIFGEANTNQTLKMRAAALLAVDEKKDAVDYLRRLSTTNDLATDIDASQWLYLIGDKEINKATVAKGLQSGDRKVKVAAVKLAGLSGDSEDTPVLVDMLEERMADIAAPAARALARLGYRDSIPYMMSMLLELNEDKGEAAVFALSRLGGQDVVKELKDKLKTSSGRSQYRVITCLYKLKDPLGKDLMIKQMRDVPTLEPEAALILARDGYWDAVQYLAGRLKRRYDDDKEDVMLYRAKAAAALVANADPTAISYVQELLRKDNANVKKHICFLLADLGKRRLIPILQATMENSDNDLALHACAAVMAIAKPDFRERYIEYQQ